MKISDVKSSSGVAASKRKKSVGRSVHGGDFSSHLAEAMDGKDPPAVHDGTPVAGVGTILAAQDVGDATDDTARHTLIRRGADILDRLDEIRRDILAGVLSKDRLVNLARLLRAKRQQTDDPRLRDILDEIELRAEVEIAKLTRGT